MSGQGEAALRRVRAAYDPAAHPLVGLLRPLLGPEDFAALLEVTARELDARLAEELAEHEVGRELEAGLFDDLYCADVPDAIYGRLVRASASGPLAAPVSDQPWRPPVSLVSDIRLALVEAAARALRQELQEAR